MIKIKKIIVCLFTANLIGNMALPISVAAKEKPVPYDLYNSYAPGEEIPTENDITTEDAPDFNEKKNSSNTP